jgi:hypothetical protein
MADAVVAAANVPLPPDDPVLGTPFVVAPAADVSGGLATLATWAPASAAATPPAPSQAGGLAAQQAAQQTAVTSLVQGNAVAALAFVYASIDWPYADAANAARTQLLGLFDVQTEAAADAGQDDLYRGWLALTALAMQDLIARAQALPSLASYRTPTPSVVLAQRLYQDPSRASGLEQLNVTWRMTR